MSMAMGRPVSSLPTSKHEAKRAGRFSRQDVANQESRPEGERREELERLDRKLAMSYVKEGLSKVGR